jgi:hypothetical protein
MGKTIDNIIGKLERITEVWFMGAIYAKYLGIDIRRDKPKRRNNSIKYYEINKPEFDYKEN